MSISAATIRENRLAKEASAYLRQHARNPVDWYAWGEEALAKAARENKPIFLSIGYSACHWCHVMERESFEDVPTAQLLNERFVSIKVDREERPDLDQLYQMSVQLLGRSGGWPLSVFLTPSQRPFFAGTYFPPAPKYGMPSFRDVLGAVLEAYADKRDAIESQAIAMASAISEVMSPRAESGTPLDKGLLGRAASRMASRFDKVHGGFGDRPKFPNTMNLEVLLRHAHGSRDARTTTKVRRALDAMRAGGIWDHLGSGFHRYSTDAKWLVPHFEKMLYDNALLARLYLDSSRALAEPRYADVARDIATYVAREMRSPRGAFYATQDADSEGEEGKFFVWTRLEVETVLANDALARDVALAHFGVTAEGNFEESDATVLSIVEPIDAIASRSSKPSSEVNSALERAKKALFAVREQREKPFRDEKILACWNGLLIGSLAELGVVTGDVALLDLARHAFAHIETTLVTGGRVARFVTDDGHVASPGFLDDHADIANAAIDLYEATGNPQYAVVARSIGDEILARFANADGEGFFYTPEGGPDLVCRVKDVFDQATPSGSSMAAMLLLRLGALVGETYAAPAARYLESVAGQAQDNPMGFGQTLIALDRLVHGSTDIVIVGPANHPQTDELRRAVLSTYVAHRTLVVIDPADPATTAAAPALADGKAPSPDGAPVAYVCRDRACSAPVRTTRDLVALLAPAIEC